MSLAAERRAAPADVTVSMVRAGMVGTLLALPPAALAGALFAGSTGAGALTAALGAGLVGATLTTGAWAVRWLLAQGQRSLVIPGAFMIAVAQLALLMALVIVLRQQGWWDDAGLALGALVAVVAVQVALVLAYLRGRRPELEVEPW